jgi:hypothetical protein
VRIGIDIDGVLFPFDTVARHVLHQRFPRHNVPEQPSKSWSALKGEVAPELWRWLWSPRGQDAVFSQTKRRYPDAIQVVRKLLTSPDHEVHFVTHRDPAITGTYTSRFLAEHFDGLRWAGLHMLGQRSTVPKWKLARWDVFVDDKPETVHAFTSGTFTQVFAPRRPWNESELEDNLYLTVYDNPGVILDYVRGKA